MISEKGRSKGWREGTLEHVVYPAGTDPGEGEMGDMGQWGEGKKQSRWGGKMGHMCWDHHRWEDDVGDWVTEDEGSSLREV